MRGLSWLRRRPAAQPADGSIKINAQRRDIALLGLASAAFPTAAAFIAATRSAQAQPVPPPPRPGHPGRIFTADFLNSVTAADYGAVDDLLGGFVKATWTNATTTLTSAYTFQGNVTIANTGPGGVALLTIPGSTSSSGLPEGNDWVGKPLACTGAGAAGGTFVAVVTAFDYSPDTSGATPTWTLSIPAPTPITASNQNLLCPCFTSGADGTGLPSCVGRYLWISDARNANALAQPVSGLYQLMDTIAVVNSPFSVTVTTTTFNSGTVTNKVGVRARWFTDNRAAIIAAWLANSGRGALLFPGFLKPQSTGMFGVVGFAGSGAFSASDGQLSRAMAEMNWVTSGRDIGVDVFSVVNVFTDYLGTSFYYKAIPFDAPSAPETVDDCGGPAAFPCSTSLTNVPMVATGDSWVAEDPSGSGNNSVARLTRRIASSNPNRNIITVNRGIGGTLWRDLSSTTNRGGAGSPPWNVGTNTFLAQTLSVPNPFGSGSVPPSLWWCKEGDNDAGVLHPNDVWGTLAQVRATTGYNGNPPDILLETEGMKGVGLFSAGGDEHLQLLKAYATGYIRSMAKANKIALLDNASAIELAQFGWTSTKLLRRLVPPIGAAVTATATAAYQFPSGYKGYGYRIGLKLGTTTGSAFWGGITTLELALSEKPDNRIVLTTTQSITGDAGGNLYVYWRSWGGIIATPTAIVNGTAALTTSGQVNTAIVGAGVLTPFPPVYTISAGGSTLPYASGNVGQCYRTPGIGYQSQDFRTIVMGFVNSGIILGCDTNDQNVSVTTQWVGGWMFKAQDAQAKANIRITDGGGNTLRTTIATFTNFQSVGLAANWTFANPAGANTTMEVGRFSAPAFTVQPLLSAVAQPVGTDADAGGQTLYVEVNDDGWCRVSIVLGASQNTDPRIAAQNGEQTVWEGYVERFGGPFIPQIWATGGTATITPLWIEIADSPRPRDLYRTRLTSEEVFGTADLNFDFPLGGDTSHYSRKAVREAFDRVYEAANLSFGPLSTSGRLDRTAIAANDTAATAVTLPAGAKLKAIYIQNTTANAVTGGLDIGTTAAGADVVSAIAVGANALVVINPGATLLKQWFSATATQQIFLTAHTAWNSASLNVRFEFDQ